MLFEVLDVAVDEVVRPLVALVNQRVVDVEAFDAGLPLVERGEVRVVLPQRRGGGADVGLEFPGGTPRASRAQRRSA